MRDEQEVVSAALGDKNKGSLQRLMTSPNFQKLWVAQFISSMGDWLIIGILIPTVMALSGGSSTAVAGILVAKIIPALFLSSITGVLVDHFDRRKIMLTTDLIRFILVLVLLTTNSLAAIYLVVLLTETASLFFWPARNALIPMMVEDEDVSMANGLMYTTQQAAMVVGLAASGAILAGFEKIVQFVLHLDLPSALHPFVVYLTPILVGSRAGYVLDSFTFIFSAALIFSMKLNAKPQVKTDEKFDLSHVGQGVVESFKLLRDRKELRGLLVTIFFAIIGGGALVTVGLDYIASLGGVVPFANRVEWIARFSGSRQTFVITFLAIGMVVGALLIPRIEKRIPVRLLFPGSVTLFAAGMLGFTLTTKYFISCLYATGAGFCIAALTVAGNNYIVAEVDDSIRGRVFTALESVIRVSLLISMMFVAPLSDILSKIIKKFLDAEGITTLLGIPLSGSRITLLIASAIVACAAVYGFRKVYFGPNAADKAALTAAEAGEESDASCDAAPVQSSDKNEGEKPCA